MKKMLASILVLLLVFCSSSFADEFDLKDMKDDEIMRLFEAVKDEVDIRGLADSEIMYPGAYVAGVDIEPGSYTIKGCDQEVGCIYIIFENDEYRRNMDSAGAIEKSMVAYEQIGRIKLEEGNSFWIAYGACEIHPQNASWMK